MNARLAQWELTGILGFREAKNGKIVLQLEERFCGDKRWKDATPADMEDLEIPMRQFN